MSASGKVLPPGMSAEDFEEATKSSSKNKKKKNKSKSSGAAAEESAPAVEAVAAQVEKVELGAGSDPDEIKKRLRNLTKKISQINKIKEKQEKGETLEPEQLEKLKTESELREEIARLEALS